MRIRRLDLAEASAYRTTAIPIWQAAFAHVLPGVPVPDEARLRPDAPDGRRAVLGAFEASDDAAAVGLSVVNGAKGIAATFWVAPVRRRRGIGSALLTESLRLTRAAGRGKLVVRVAGGADSEGFARARGGRFVERDSMSGLDLRAIDRRAFEDWAAASPEYTLARWSDHCPDELAASFCSAMGAMADAPGDAYDSPLTVEALREKEQALLRFGIHRHVQAALAEDGQIAGFTNVVTVEDRPGVVEVWNTAVVRAHRGRGLGLRVKAAAALWILDAYPDSRWIFTSNHEANAPMLTVNRALGYRPLVDWLTFEFDAR
jgi:GNAT superfamily N-acetyltransferase